MRKVLIAFSMLLLYLPSNGQQVQWVNQAVSKYVTTLSTTDSKAQLISINQRFDTATNRFQFYYTVIDTLGELKSSVTLDSIPNWSGSVICDHDNNLGLYGDHRYFGVFSKYNKDGHLLWRVKRSDFNGACYQAAFDDDRCSILGGYTHASDPNDSMKKYDRAVIAKYSCCSKELWRYYIHESFPKSEVPPHFHGVAVDKDGNIFAAAHYGGRYCRSAWFDTIQLNPKHTFLLVKLSRDGKLQWLKTLNMCDAYMYRLQVDRNGSVYVFNCLGITQYYSRGDSINTYHGYTTVDPMGRLFYYGHFKDSTVFKINDPACEDYPAISYQSNYKYTLNPSTTILGDNFCNYYLRYSFYDSLSFDHVKYHSEKLGSYTSILMRIKGKPVSPEEIKPPVNPFLLYPNPNNGTFTLQSLKLGCQHLRLELFDAAGRWLTNISYEVTGDPAQQNIRINDLNPGVYFLHVIQENGQSTVLPFVHE